MHCTEVNKVWKAWGIGIKESHVKRKANMNGQHGWLMWDKNRMKRKETTKSVQTMLGVLSCNNGWWRFPWQGCPKYPHHPQLHHQAQHQFIFIICLHHCQQYQFHHSQHYSISTSLATTSLGDSQGNEDLILDLDHAVLQQAVSPTLATLDGSHQLQAPSPIVPHVGGAVAPTTAGHVWVI